jgi:uncharacterized protein YndB with AHSA1/START domain
MMAKETETPARVVVRRTFPVSRDKVFRAWTDPEQIVRWMTPRESVVAELAEFDVRVGGRYRIGYRTPRGLLIVGGSFTCAIVPEKLVYTWTWEPPSDEAGIETLVTVEFLDLGGSTELVLTHERLPNQISCERHEHGWTEILASLAVFVEAV